MEFLFYFDALLISGEDTALILDESSPTVSSFNCFSSLFSSLWYAVAVLPINYQVLNQHLVLYSNKVYYLNMHV